MDGLVDVKAFDRGAGLSCATEGRPEDPRSYGGGVDVVEHDRRVIAAEFEEYPFDASRCVPSDGLAGRDAARKADHPGQGVANDCVADVVATGNHVHDARWYEVLP